MRFSKIELLCRLAGLAYDNNRMDYSFHLYMQAVQAAEELDGVRVASIGELSYLGVDPRYCFANFQANS